MLKGISRIISPELLMILDKMGHGDEIVIGDGNFPAASVAKRLVRLDGHGVNEVLDAVLPLFPLDSYDSNVYLMDKTESDRNLDIPIWEEYRKIAAEYTDKEPVFLERFAFYERAKKAYCVVVTGERAVYANVILKKGVVK